MNHPQALLFDLDGVLLNTEPLHGQAWFFAAKSFGATLSKNQLVLLRGRRREDCAKQIINWIDKPIDFKEFLSVHHPISKELVQQANAMPGAENLVKWCFQNQMPMALVSSSSSESVAFKSAPHKWLELIQTKVLGDDPSLKSGKPSPEPFLLAAKKLSVKASRCWAIEDSLSGTKSALAASCQVWVLIGKEINKDLYEKKSNINPSYISDLNTILGNLKSL